MTEQNDKSLRFLHVLSLCLLITGFLGILFNVAAHPDRFPTVSLYVTATGAMLSVAVSTKYLIWRQYEK